MGEVIQGGNLDTVNGGLEFANSPSFIKVSLKLCVLEQSWYKVCVMSLDFKVNW